MTQPYQIDLRALSEGDESELRRFYLDYVNDFLTYRGVAEYYGLKLESVTAWIEQGRALHEAHCARIKRESV